MLPVRAARFAVTCFKKSKSALNSPNPAINATSAGIKPKIPVPTMYAAGFVGFTGGYLLAYQQSWGRLVGRLPPK